MTANESRRFLRVVGGVLLEGDRVLIVRRPPHDKGGGFWEFPGGKIEHGETPDGALVRELDEELGLRVEILGDLGWSRHAYETTDIELNVMICRRLSGDLTLHEHDAMAWVLPEDLKEPELLAADRPFVQRLREWMAQPRS